MSHRSRAGVRVSSCVGVLVALVAIGHAALSVSEVAKIPSPPGAHGDSFGWSVAVDGDTMFAGVPVDSYATIAGSVLVLSRVGSAWQSSGQTITDADGAPNDYFGAGVSISGDTLVVGAHGDDRHGQESGSVVVYSRVGTTWVQRPQKLAPADGAAADFFGNCVSIDGDTLAVGAYGDDDRAGGAGAVYVFDRFAGVWTQTAKLYAPDAGSVDFFGTAVALSGDVLVVGANAADDRGTSSGAAYVFERTNGVWSAAAPNLTAYDGTSFDRLGSCVAIENGVIAVGANGDDDRGPDTGAVYLFVEEAGQWVAQTPKVIPTSGTGGDWFGSSVAIDAGTLYGGAFRPGANGCIYEFSSAGAPLPPTADAGPDQSIHTGQIVQLDGGGSFDDETAANDLVYAWTLASAPAGSVAVLSDPAAQAPTFVADLSGSYELDLVVTDEGGLASEVDRVKISSNNIAPTADAGTDQVVQVGTVAVLDGSGSSDPELDPLSYAWSLSAAPEGSNAVLSGVTTSAPTIVPDVEGSYILVLVTHDGFAASIADSVEVVAVGPVFAQQQLAAACDFVAALPDGSFDAKGHRNSMCNDYAKIIRSIQKERLGKALAQLDHAIERVDGQASRGRIDPKGNGQEHAADFVVHAADQVFIYELLDAAREGLE